jgi:hypothetical protein
MTESDRLNTNKGYDEAQVVVRRPAVREFIKDMKYCKPEGIQHRENSSIGL